jgi:ribosome maturation protein Sdo1
MTTKTPQQKILQEILHTENESKQNHERMEREEKTRNERVTLIQLHTIKPLNNKNN